MLNVQASLAQRYPGFLERHRRTARILFRFLVYLFYESRFQQFARDYPHLEGFDFVEQVLRYFDFSLRLRDSERERIPASGRVLVAANHPIGSLDGLALLNLVRQVRPDVKVVANNLLTAIGPLQSLLLPVSAMGGSSTRNDLRLIREHLDNEGALIIFPAGEVSRFGPRGVRDGEWHSGFVRMAAAAKAPILPVFVAGRNSLFFYSLSFLAKPLSTVWLVREMFKQNHNTVDTRVGNPVPYKLYAGAGDHPREIARRFRRHVYRLARNKRPLFQTEETVAHPENRILLKREIRGCEHLGDTPDGMRILLHSHPGSDCIMREIGRLRELTFRTVGEGSGKPRDIDRYDRDYHQLLLWDPEALEIAGAYRIGITREILERRGLEGLYTHSLYAFDEQALAMLRQGIELGRSFVQPAYQGRRSLDYLWLGIGAFIRRYPDYRYLFGAVSIGRLFPMEAIARIIFFYTRYYHRGNKGVYPRVAYVMTDEQRRQCERLFTGGGLEADFRILRHYLSAQGLMVPPLYKHYADVAELAGVQFHTFSVDTSFGDCIDSLVSVDLTRLKPQKKKRYLGEDFRCHGST